MKKYLHIFTLLVLFQNGYSQKRVTEHISPTPSQLTWQDMEYYLFMHFGPNTFTNLEWGKGNENAEVFDPKDMDCDQWCRIARDAGAKGIIITAKHHDGFCLWPSKFSTHTVRESSWKNGKGDVLKELSEACKKYNLKFGVYLSPWDRNHPAYGTPAYNTIFENMLREIFSDYGPIWELWWDGANGEGPNGKKQVYDFHAYEQLIRRISPQTIIFSDIGPDARWCGNEKGIAGKTNWNLLDTAGFKRGAGGPSVDTLNQGNKYGKNWIPAECDVSIRPGWFYHKNEDSLVKTPAELFEIYLKSVGRGANLLLNVPPDTRGLISSFDSSSLMGFQKLREKSFKTDLSKEAEIFFIDGTKTGNKIPVDDNAKVFGTITFPGKQSIGMVWDQPKSVNCIVLTENLEYGQHCAKFKIELLDKDQQIIKEISGTTIGHKRMLSFPEREIYAMRFTVLSQKAPTIINSVQAFLIPGSLVKNE